jgi:hypothetical protein
MKVASLWYNNKSYQFMASQVYDAVETFLDFFILELQIYE